MDLHFTGPKLKRRRLGEPSINSAKGNQYQLIFAIGDTQRGQKRSSQNLTTDTATYLVLLSYTNWKLFMVLGITYFYIRLVLT